MRFSTTRQFRIGLWLLLVTVISNQFAISKTWQRRDGGKAEAELIGFDYDSKTVTLTNQSHNEFTINSADLTYQSRLAVMISPYFHGGLPSGWGKEKTHLAILVLLVPSVLFILGLWLAGMIIARKFSPLKAIIGFIGSWLVAAILIACYLMIASKSPGSAKAILTFGGVLAFLCSAMFVSAIYQTTYLKGLLIFLAHFIFASALAVGIWIGINSLADPAWLDTFMTKHVFIPIGLVPAGAPPI